MQLRRPWVIFWPKTVSRLPRADSSSPVRVSRPKYSSTCPRAAGVPAVSVSTIFASTSGGSRAETTAPTTVSTMPRLSHTFFCTV